uniref:AcrIIA14 protein n=1 Tax=Staphylococcus simulans TaxID=1286 RepID=UPI001FE24379
SMKSVKYISNMSKQEKGYRVYVNVVNEDTDKGFLFPSVPKEVIENDKIDELFNFEHHKPYVQKAKSRYDKNGIGYKIVQLDEGFQKFIELNKEKMKENLDY